MELAVHGGMVRISVLREILGGIPAALSLSWRTRLVIHLGLIVDHAMPTAIHRNLYSRKPDRRDWNEQGLLVDEQFAHQK